jgi:hypothetical protein
MGEIADMMLEGLLDSETGEYIGDINEGIYGDAAPGFPVTYERRVKGSRNKAGLKINCPVCGKRVKTAGLAMHRRDVHGSEGV